MMNRKVANEMAKDIARGVPHYDNLKDKADFVVKVFERYGVVEKEKDNSLVFGSNVKTDANLKEDCSDFMEEHEDDEVVL